MTQNADTKVEVHRRDEVVLVRHTTELGRNVLTMSTDDAALLLRDLAWVLGRKIVPTAAEQGLTLVPTHTEILAALA